jgi:hypothetical protein
MSTFDRLPDASRMPGQVEKCHNRKSEKAYSKRSSVAMRANRAH